MALSFGSSLATKVYLGATEINLAYFGATQVYSSAAFSAEAQNYFSRLDAAGDTTYVDYKQPLANYIDGLVTNGLWNGLLSAACFVGVGFQGMLVPLKSGMPTLTNNFFLGTDLDQLNGLLGNGSTKYLGTGITKNDLLQNDLSMSVYFTQAGTPNNVQAFIGATTTALIQLNASSNTPRIANSGGSFTDLDRGVGFYGASRDNSAGFDIRFKGTDYASTETSIAITGTTELSVFARTTTLFSDWGIGTYHIGTSVGAAGLITLETLQATLITEVAEAQFSAEAANYFARLAVAGDTTHYTYRQPLANYIDGLVALGGAYWDDMVSACSFVGVGIQGITVPLRAGMAVATNNNLVAGDLDQLTGLKGDGSTKYINANVTDSDTSQDDVSMSCWVSTGTVVNNAVYMGTTRTGMLATTAAFAPKIKSRSTSSNQVNVSPTLVRNFFGHTRTNSADFDYSINGATGTATRTSIASVAEDVGIFNTGSSNGVYSDSRLATYHYGPALNLATLEGTASNPSVRSSSS